MTDTYSIAGVKLSYVMLQLTLHSTNSARGIHGAYTLEENDVNRLIGQILTLIDTLGLPERQEKAIGDLVKQKVWGTMDDSFYINGKILILAQDMDWQIRDENQQLHSSETTKEEREKGLHPAWIKGDFSLTFQQTK